MSYNIFADRKARNVGVARTSAEVLVFVDDDAVLGGDSTLANLVEPLLAGNRRELFEVTVAAQHGGWIVVPVNWHWVAEELAYVLDDSDAKALVVDGRFLDVALDALADPRAAGVTTRVVIADDAPADFVTYEALLTEGDPSEPTEQSSGGPMFYTSGTTGFPKGVRSVLTTVGQDPALSSGIWLTTFTDVIGFSMFLSLGTIFLAKLAGM